MEGIDGLTRWLGVRWQAADRVRMPIREDLLNFSGMLAGPVTYALVDYCMGSTLWQARGRGEAIATISIAINYVQTAREGDVFCTARLDRRNDRIAVLSAEVKHADERLLATAIGSYSIFPRERLGGHEDRGGAAAPAGAD